MAHYYDSLEEMIDGISKHRSLCGAESWVMMIRGIFHFAGTS